MNQFYQTGYFVGNFFGLNDSWKGTRESMTFLSKQQVLDLFKNFKIISFMELEEDGVTGLGNEKHWHIFGVTARKKGD